jgi:hypothetical protein
MSDFKPRPGTFRPFLEYTNKEYANLEKTAPAHPSPLTLLDILSRAPERSLPVFDLQTRSRMEPSSYGESLKSLRNAGYIVIEGDVPDQTITLTESGSVASQFARSA